jgi:hypothetical protein
MTYFHGVVASFFAFEMAIAHFPSCLSLPFSSLTFFLVSSLHAFLLSHSLPRVLIALLPLRFTFTLIAHFPSRLSLSSSCPHCSPPFSALASFTPALIAHSSPQFLPRVLIAHFPPSLSLSLLPPCLLTYLLVCSLLCGVGIWSNWPRCFRPIPAPETRRAICVRAWRSCMVYLRWGLVLPSAFWSVCVRVCV